MGSLTPSALLDLADEMCSRGVRRFCYATGEVEFDPTTLASLAADKRAQAERKHISDLTAEAGDAEDVKRIMAQEEERKRVRDHFGSVA